MRLHSLLIIPLLWLPTLACHAEVTEYDFEVVIFEDLSNRYIDSEQWPRLEYQRLAELYIESKKSAAIDKNNPAIVSSSDLDTMKKYTKLLNTSGRYNVLVHKSWRQTGLDAESAINIKISSDNGTDSRKSVQTSSNSSLTKPSDNSGALKSSINGDIKIILGRYLHIYTDLIYRKPTALYPPELLPMQSDRYKEFAIKSHRRMRSKELHYIDHPLVGILVKALPVEKTKEDAQQGAAR